MDHLWTDRDLPAGKATLLVFTPDAMQSQLVGPVERWIRERTGCAPIARRWVSQTEASLRRFYGGIPNLSPDDWRLLCAFFTAGPCLATLWFGDDACRALPAVKGATHPAHCPASTLRGRFWCDSSLANLVHVSDDPGEVARELAVLRSLEPDLFSGPLPSRGLPPFQDPGPASPRHSSVLTLCSVVAPLVRDAGSALPRLDPPASGDARETMARAEAWLERARAHAPPAVADAVAAYLEGTARPSDFLRALGGAAPIDAWQALILRCGIPSRRQWLESR